MHSRNQKILYTKTITSLIFTIFKWVLTMSHNKDKNSGLSVCSHSGASLAWCQILVLSNSQPLNPIFCLFPQPHLYICTQRVLLNGCIFLCTRTFPSAPLPSFYHHGLQSSCLGRPARLSLWNLPRVFWKELHSFFTLLFYFLYSFIIRLTRFNPEGRDYFSLCVPFSC